MADTTQHSLHIQGCRGSDLAAWLSGSAMDVEGGQEEETAMEASWDGETLNTPQPQAPAGPRRQRTPPSSLRIAAMPQPPAMVVSQISGQAPNSASSPSSSGHPHVATTITTEEKTSSSGMDMDALSRNSMDSSSPSGRGKTTSNVSTGNRSSTSGDHRADMDADLSANSLDTPGHSSGTSQESQTSLGKHQRSGTPRIVRGRDVTSKHGKAPSKAKRASSKVKPKARLMSSPTFLPPSSNSSTGSSSDDGHHTTHVNATKHDLLIIDMRSAWDYKHSHIFKVSVHVCLPTLFLKRPTYDAARIEASLESRHQQTLFRHRKLTRRIVFITAECSTSPPVSVLLLKEKLVRNGCDPDRMYWLKGSGSCCASHLRMNDSPLFSL